MSEEGAHTELPKAYVKRLMKLNDAVGQVTNESVAATAKATELFIEYLLAEAQRSAVSKSRKTIKVETRIANSLSHCCVCVHAPQDCTSTS
jgi:histone H3/H4